MASNALAMMMPRTDMPGVDPTRQPVPGMTTSTAVAPAPMQAPQRNALANPMAANFNPPKPKQQNMLLSAAVNGFQRGLDPQGWQAGQDRAKADKAEGVKKQIAMLQNIRALPMEQRMQALPQISQSLGKQLPPELMQDEAIDTHLAVLMGEAGIAPSVPEPMSEYQHAQVGLEERKLAAPKPPIEVNGVLVDPVTYEPVYTAPKDPKYFNTGQAVVSVGPDGKASVLYRDPQKPSGSSAQYRWATPDEVKAAGLPPGTSMQINTENGQAVVKSQPRQTTQWDPVQTRKFKQSVGGLDLLNTQIDTYTKTLKDSGGPQGVKGFWNVEQVNAIDAARNNVLVLAKELYELGALVGADFGIIESAIKPATGLESTGQTNESIAASLAQVQSMLKNKMSQIPQEFVEQVRGDYTGDMATRFTPKAEAPSARQGGQIVDPLAATGQVMQQSIQDAMRKALTQDNGQNDDDTFIDSLFPADVGGAGDEPPEGVDPQDWEYFTPEMKQQYLQGAQ